MKTWLPVRLTLGKKPYSLAELLEGADEMADLSADASAWNSAPRMGNEAL